MPAKKKAGKKGGKKEDGGAAEAGLGGAGPADTPAEEKVDRAWHRAAGGGGGWDGRVVGFGDGQYSGEGLRRCDLVFGAVLAGAAMGRQHAVCWVVFCCGLCATFVCLLLPVVRVGGDQGWWVLLFQWFSLAGVRGGLQAAVAGDGGAAAGQAAAELLPAGAGQDQRLLGDHYRDPPIPSSSSCQLLATSQHRWQSSGICMYTRARACACVHICVCIRVRVCVSAHACICLYLCMHVCVLANTLTRLVWMWSYTTRMYTTVAHQTK